MEMDKTERELRLKLELVESQSRELGLQERDYLQRLAEQQEESKKLGVVYDALQEETDRFNLEKENFDRRAQAVKEQGEHDQHDSEKIGFCKGHDNCGIGSEKCTTPRSVKCTTHDNCGNGPVNCLEKVGHPQGS